MVDAKLILGILGNIICIIMYLSPIPTFWTILKNKSTLRFSGLPYTLTLFNCILRPLLRAASGMPLIMKGGILLFILNVAGGTFSFIYVTLFLIYTDRKRKLKFWSMLAAYVLTVTTIACVTRCTVKQQLTRHVVVESSCMVLTTAMYGSPLSVMKRVIKTKSTAFMPFYLSLAMVLTTICWAGYGIVSRNYFIMTSNCIGLVFGISQLVLHAIYCHKKAPIDLEAGAFQVVRTIRMKTKMLEREIMRKIVPGSIEGKCRGGNKFRKGSVKLAVADRHMEKHFGKEKFIFALADGKIVVHYSRMEDYASVIILADSAPSAGHTPQFSRLVLCFT